MLTALVRYDFREWETAATLAKISASQDWSGGQSSLFIRRDQQMPILKRSNASRLHTGTVVDRETTEWLESVMLANSLIYHILRLAIRSKGSSLIFLSIGSTQKDLADEYDLTVIGS